MYRLVAVLETDNAHDYVGHARRELGGQKVVPIAVPEPGAPLRLALMLEAGSPQAALLRAHYGLRSASRECDGHDGNVRIQLFDPSGDAGLGDDDDGPAAA